MGGGASKQPAAASSIDLQLIDQQLEDLFKFKVLLLGAGESGKSTVVKQLKLIHKKDLTAKELKVVALSLHQNVVDCSRALIAAARSFGATEWDADSLKTEEMLAAHDEDSRISPELGERIVTLFHTENIQKAFERRSEFWLLDSFPYYVKNLSRFTEPNFVPSEEDSVMARIRTTGIVNSELSQPLVKDSNPAVAELEPEALKFQVVDVGGQRNERKKWMHCLDESMQILTSQGFIGLQQIEQQLAKQDKQQHASTSTGAATSTDAEPLLRVAEYCPMTHALRYVVLEAQNLVKQPVDIASQQGMVELTCGLDAQRWEQHGSGEKQTAATTGNGVSLLVTPDHDLFVSSAADMASGWSAPSKIKAQQLLPLEDRSQRRYRFVDFAAGGLEDRQQGVDGSELPLPVSSFAQQLGLRERSQMAAFCALYGYWLASSSSCDSAAVTLLIPDGQAQAHTAAWLREQLGNAGLEQGSGWTTDAAASAVEPQSVIITDARWSGYFAQLQQQRAVVEELLLQLSKHLARALLAGFASAGSSFTSPDIGGQQRTATAGELQLAVSSAALRDDLVRVGLHAGYSVHFYAASSGDSWQIVCSERTVSSDSSSDVQQQQSVLSSANDKISFVSASGKHSWCVKVPSGLIVTRRAECCPATGVVMQASRPLVIGNCFDDVRAILFCVNLAGYNQVLFEDVLKNRMHEELELFEQITSNQLFEFVPIFLFLNKKDLFEQMVPLHDLRKTFPSYAGGRGDVNAALEFVCEQFRHKLPPGKSVSIHPVSARWTRDIAAAFNDVKRGVYDSNKEELLAQAKAIRAQRKTVARGEDAGGCGCA